MVLGELIRDLGTGERLVDLLNRADQAVLVLRLEKAATRYDETVGDYAVSSIERFVNRANDEAWLALMSAVEKYSAKAFSADAKADLGAVCLRIMLDWALCEEEHRLKHVSKAIKPLYDEDCGGLSPCFLRET